MVSIWWRYGGDMVEIWDSIAAQRAEIAEGLPKDHRRNKSLNVLMRKCGNALVFFRNANETSSWGAVGLANSAQ